jgi:Ni/Co efflux regulator RcnB
MKKVVSTLALAALLIGGTVNAQQKPVAKEKAKTEKKEAKTEKKAEKKEAKAEKKEAKKAEAKK